MDKVSKGLRKVVVGVIGFPLFALGLVLIPLPGPGILVCVAALFVLSLEFDWARRYFDKSKAELKKIIDKSKARQEEINSKYK